MVAQQLVERKVFAKTNVLPKRQRRVRTTRCDYLQHIRPLRNQFLGTVIGTILTALNPFASLRETPMDKEAEAYRAGARGEIFLGDTFAERLAHEKGENSRSGGGGGGIFLLPVMAILMACLWPLVAAGTVLFAGIGSWLLERV